MRAINGKPQEIDHQLRYRLGILSGSHPRQSWTGDLYSRDQYLRGLRVWEYPQRLWNYGLEPFVYAQVRNCLSAKGALVLRAGYSLTNEQAISARDGIYNYPEILGYNASAVNPFVPVGTLTAGIPQTPAPDLGAGIISPIPSGINFQTVPLNFVRGYVQSYNATVQKGFGAWIAQVAYVGTHSIHGHSRHPSPSLESAVVSSIPFIADC